MASINKVILAGNLTRDPETKYFANERCSCSFGLAINRRYRGADGETKEDVTYVDIEAWGRTAELVGQNCTKGSSVLIEGRLRLDQWDDKQTGAKRSKLKVVADTVQFLSPKPITASGNTQPAAPSVAPPALDDEEPPF